MVARFTSETCPRCHRKWDGFGLEPLRAFERHRSECDGDPFLIEAMREVDALTPACPPIAPQPSPIMRLTLRGPDTPPAPLRRGFIRNQGGEWPDPPPLPEPDVDLFEVIQK